MTMENPPIDELQRIESLAAELAALAGADIQFALGKAMQVSYKGSPGGCAIRFPRLITHVRS